MKIESNNPMEVPLIMDLLDRSLEGYFFALAFHVDPNVTQYTIGNLLPYECNFGRTAVFSSDEYAMTLHCRVKGIQSGELVMQGTFNATKDAPRRTAIYIQYDGHPETLGYDFDSIGEAIAVLRLFAAGKIRGAQNRLKKTRK